MDYKKQFEKEIGINLNAMGYEQWKMFAEYLEIQLMKAEKVLKLIANNKGGCDHAKRGLDCLYYQDKAKGYFKYQGDSKT